MANQLKNRYDIIINGGGVVGFTLLNLIMKSPYLNRCKVLLIEQASRPTILKQPSRMTDSSSNSVSEQASQEPLFSNRVSSITRKSRCVLEMLGIWSDIRQYAKDVKTIKVWNYNYSNKIVFQQNNSDSSDATNDVMFSVVENNRLAISMLDKIYQYNDQVIKWNNNLIGISNSKCLDGTIEIKTKDNKNGDEYIACAPLVLGCDGFKSKVREYAHINYSEVSLNKTAVVGTVKLDSNLLNSNNDIAYQRFSNDKNTVAALLPLDENYSSFVISAPESYAKHLMDCDNDKFIEEFNDLLSTNERESNPILTKLHEVTNFANKALAKLFDRTSFAQSNMINEVNFGHSEPPKVISVINQSRAVFPLIFGTTTPKMIASLQGKEYPQIALLGDSSHRVHPLAGQGLNLGILDAMELVYQLEAISKCGERIFDDKDQSLLSKALKRYQTKRQSYIIPMSLGILSMPYLFKLAPTSVISLFDRMVPLKKATVKFANGI